MKKVQITAEQEQALKEWMAGGLNFVSFVKSRYRGKWTMDDLKPLNTITPEQFSLMLNGWYEVIDDIRVGDWVKYKDEQIRFGEKISFNKKNEISKEILKYYKIVEKYSEGAQSFCELSLQFANVNSHLFEKVESWEAMLLELGRKKPELKIGDYFTTKKKTGVHICDQEDQKTHMFRLEKGIIEMDCFYPVESRIEVKNQ